MPCPGPRFVVTGAGRSGTTFIATVLERLSCATGHEVVFDAPLRGVPDFGDRHGDVSWAVVPLLHRLRPGTVVLHQVRQPLHVIRSVADYGITDDSRLGFSLRHDVLRRSVVSLERRAAAIGLPVRPRSGSLLEYRRMTAGFRPRVFEAESRLGRAARYWVEWNRAVEEGAGQAALPYRRYRVEDLDAPLLVELLALVGHEIDEERCQEALDSIPRDINRRTVSRQLTWADLPPEERAEVQQLATRYGYDAVG